jgi:hypothetical protein
MPTTPPKSSKTRLPRLLFPINSIQRALPGTRLRNQMKSEDRIALDMYPQDWKYYTLTLSVARYKNLSLVSVIEEMTSCERDFYSMPRILNRVLGNLWHRRQPLINLVGNLSYRKNLRLNSKAYADFKRCWHNRHNCVKQTRRAEVEEPIESHP